MFLLKWKNPIQPNVTNLIKLELINKVQQPCFNVKPEKLKMFIAINFCLIGISKLTKYNLFSKQAFETSHL